MKMFLGEYQPNITEGSRIALPKKMREQIQGKTVILSRGIEKCIFVYDLEDWRTEAQKQVDNKEENAKRRDIERYLFATAVEVAIDAQGRMVLPSTLLDYAQINEETAVVGVGERIEIWDRALWKEHFEKISTQLAV
ncbi:division/cell wall cluster transcriptional repressor MraZ [Patescibacteria group bacterium]|nr:division/cell wall cluster transcriptional repressor MraZ [Patescibacteria group bacterium]